MSVVKPRALWLFSARVDLSVFLGSAAVSLALLPLGAYLGLLEGTDTSAPEWTWVTMVLLIDVAHVWATGFRVYFDPAEFRRRTLLYVAVPVLAYVAGIALYSESEQLFWRVLAYVAVFHFVRQQYGWVALYRVRVGERDRLGSWLDAAAVYLATVYPLIYWHAHLPRKFWWFLPGDFVELPTAVERILAPVYWLVLALYAIRSLHQWIILRKPNPGKDVVVGTTALCWYVGIVSYNSDFAFTVTNVIIHGVPYFALVYWYRVNTADEPWKPGRTGRLLMFFATLWLLAYMEELLWDRGVWHRREWLFGESWNLAGWRMWLVPLLALPQITHYVLDGFIWKRKSNPGLERLFEKKPLAV